MSLTFNEWKPRAALTYVDRAIALDPLAMALAATAAGDKGLALNYIEEGLREHSLYMIFLRADLKFDALRNEPRFQAVLRELERNYASVH